MTQAERGAVAADPSRSRPGCSARCCPAAARCRRRNTPEAWADMVDMLPAGGAGRPGCRSRCSTASTPCTGTATWSARRSSRTTSGSARPATRSWCERIGHVTAEETRATGIALGLRAVRLRGARRPLGPHLRELRRGPGAGDAAWRPSIDGLQGTRPASSTTTTACWRPPSTTPATADTDVRHRGSGDYTIDQGIDESPAAPDFDATRRSRRTSRRSHGHDVGTVMPSFSSVDWTEDGVGNPVKMHANQRADHRRAEGRDRLRRVRDLATGRASTRSPGD